MDLRDLVGRNAGFQSHCQLPSDVPDRVEPSVEGRYFFNRFVDRCGDFEKIEILGIDQFAIQELPVDEAGPLVPVVTARSLEADDRLGIALAGLGKGQNLKSFVVGSEAAGEERNCVGFLLEDQFPGEEVL